MAKHLVTGADGFIGSHLVEALVKKGCEVRALSYYNSFNHWGWLETLPKEIMDHVEVITGDVRDSSGVHSAAIGCEKIYHLAALIGIPFSYHSPQTYIDTNISGTLNVLQAARNLNLEKVVITSTSECYGSAQYVPIDEKHPLVGQSPYSASKIAADQLAYSYFASFNTPVIIVRPFNTFGPRQSARAIIPTIITQILNGVRDIKMGNIEARRDFNFVEDTVQGFLKAGDCSKESLGEVFNISSEVDYSIKEVVELISALMNIKVNMVIEEKRIRPEKSEVNRLLGNSQKAKKVLGYLPRFAGEEGFKEALLMTIKWFSHIDNLKQYKSNLYNV